MKVDQPSTTAMNVALSRAAHQILDAPSVLEDPIATRIVGTTAAERIRSHPKAYRRPFARMLRSFVVARSRFVEDELGRAVQRGVRQYVILGAGLDTFGYRNPHPHLRVFEVDHPSTQALKRERLKAGEIVVSPNLAFVAFDFETRTLAQALADAGLRLDEPVFFSWLGVTMYLSEDTVTETLRWIRASAAEGSQVIFDYVVPLRQHHPARRLALRILMLWLAALGEPWKAFFDPAALAILLKEMGFRRIDDMGPEEINAMFFEQRADRLKVGRAGHLMSALV